MSSATIFWGQSRKGMKKKTVIFLIFYTFYTNKKLNSFLLLAATQLNLAIVDLVIYITVQHDCKLFSTLVENGFVHNL